MSRRAEEWWLHACSSERLRCTEAGMVMLGFNGWGLQVHLTLTVNCALHSCLLITRAFKIVSLGAVFSLLKLSRFSLSELLSKEIGPYNLFSDMSFGGSNIHFVRIQWSLDSMIWELRPLWVSAVHGWVGVSGHLAESLSRISFLRFLVLRFHSSFDRAQTCGRYFRIWKHWSKHTT